MFSQGPSEEDFQATRDAADVPEKAGVGGITVFLLEIERPLFLSSWAAELSLETAAQAGLKRQGATETKAKNFKL